MNKTPRARKAYGPDDIFTIEEKRLIYLACKRSLTRNKAKWNRLMVWGLATFCGLRSSEISLLDGGDVQPFEVRDAAGRQVIKRPVIHVRDETAKYESGRDVPLDWWNYFRLDVIEYMAYRFGDDWNTAAGRNRIQHWPLIVSERLSVPARNGNHVPCHGRRLERDAIRDTFIAACGGENRPAATGRKARRNKLGIVGRKITTHTGRHTFCSHALHAKYTLAQVSAAAGHSDTAITSLYLHAVTNDPGDVDRGAASEALINGNSNGHDTHAAGDAGQLGDAAPIIAGRIGPKTQGGRGAACRAGNGLPGRQKSQGGRPAADRSTAPLP